MNPSTATYNALRETMILYDNTSVRARDIFFTRAAVTFIGTLFSFHAGLAEKVEEDLGRITSYTALSAEQQRRLVELR
jgi:hypothetical protein